MTAPNVHTEELQKFAAMASGWWDPNGPLKTLHDINPLRLGWIREQAGPLDGQRVLDVGCGGGLLTEALARDGAQVTGIDLGEEALQVARLHGLESELSVHYECVSAEDYAAQHAAAFDLVTCMEMLEHVPDPASIVRACAQLVRPGGVVCFSTLNRTPRAFFMAIVGAEYLLRMLPRGTHHYEQFITPAELARAARDAGLQVHTITGLHPQPLAKGYRLGSGPLVNYLMAARRDAA